MNVFSDDAEIVLPLFTKLAEFGLDGPSLVKVYTKDVWETSRETKFFISVIGRCRKEKRLVMALPDGLLDFVIALR